MGLFDPSGSAAVSHSVRVASDTRHAIVRSGSAAHSQQDDAEIADAEKEEVTPARRTALTADESDS